MSKESWVGFPDVADRTGGDIIMGHAGLPVGLDPECLQLNVDALRRGVIRLGGYEGLILSSYQGDADQVNLGVGGADGSGSAYATAATSITKAESSRHDSSSDPEKNEWDARNGVLSIKWNTEALKSRIKIDQQYDPKIRAARIQKEVRKNALKGVVEHNTTQVLQDKSLIGNIFDVGLDAFFLYSVGDSLSHSNYGEIGNTLVWRFFLTNVLFRAFHAHRVGVGFSKDMISDPFFFSMRPLRVAAATGVLASSKLVRAAPTAATQKEQ